ncbi:MAG: serine/threonine-protein kinase, partial [Kofleriaceae bacterium]
MTGGEVLRGNASAQYELLARLAQGGMAEIFLARANGLAGFERYVVLKRIRPERDDDPRWVTMFLDEARLAAQLQHPNIAQVFDLGQIGDSFFYTMEFVHGEDVLDVLSRTSALGQRMPLHISLAVAAGACTGLAYAHDRHGVDGQPLHIVHRDISPANLMVSFDGVVKVLDFGVAKARNRDTKTEAGTIMGKVAYLSPEQCQTNEIDHRSDLFSLGIVLYEMVTHVRPFKRGTDYETLAAIVRFDPPPPSSVNPALPRGIDDLVMRALAKDPRNRWSSAHEMLEAIEAVADQAQASLAPRDLKRYMRDLYGTPPEPWRTIGGVEDVMGTFSGEVIGPLPTETRIKAFPADAMADDVPLLPLARSGVIGTPGAQHSHHAFEHDDLDDAAMTPHVSYRPVPARLPTDDLVDAAPTPIDMQPIRVHPTIERPPPIATPARATPP